MSKLCLFFAAAIVFPAAALAVDGVTLINQSTVLAAGGFPYNITQSGSYKLSGNLIANGKTAINITGTFVVLDLNGFNVGCSGCSGVPGIVSSGIFTTILNGTVNGFVGSSGTPYGIYFQAADGRVDRVTANANGSGIVSDAGMDLTVMDSLAVNNFTDGIAGGGALTVINCKVSGNGITGVVVENGLVTGSTISGNGAAGAALTFYGGIRVNNSASITNNTIINNGAQNHGFGIFTAGPVVTGVGMNTFFGNGFQGVADMTGDIRSLKNNMCGGGNVC